MSLQDLFTVVLNMSITSSYVAIGVILVRMLLKKAPRIFSYLLWSVVLFRLLCPVSIQTNFSLLNLLNINFNNPSGSPEYVPMNIGYMHTPTVQSGIERLDLVVNTVLPQATPVASVNPMQVWMGILSAVWVAGMVVLLIYSVISYIKTKRNLRFATLVKDNIYESDQITTAFVCGLIYPKIYIPANIDQSDLPYILSHERTHIRRKDPLVKFISFLALIPHWFNPVMWLSFNIMSKDMEMSCDETVLRSMNQDIRRGYSNSLLSLSLKNRNPFTANPLAFGESHVKSRIKNIVNYKKPVFWVITASIILVLVVGISFISNPVNGQPDLSFLNPNSMLSTIAEQEQIIIESVEYGESAVSGTEFAKWLDIAENRWKRIRRNIPNELTPSITVHVNVETGNEIRFFESETYVMTVYQDEFRYYKMPEQDYQSIRQMAASGIPHVQQITVTNRENGEDINKITTEDEKIIMRMAVLMQQGERYKPSLFFDSTLNDEPPVSDYLKVEMTGEHVYHRYYLYTQDNKSYYIDKPYERIHKIDSGIMNTITSILNNSGFDIEQSLDLILSSPLSSSDAQDYINAHKDEYENILKHGGEKALRYMLSEFKAEKAEGLRGAVMMILCKELLGPRNNVKDPTLTPQQWYAALEICLETKLPHFEYEGDDPIEKLVYTTEIQQRAASEKNGFIIAAPKIFGSYEEDELLKVFVTTFAIRYELYGDTLSEVGGSIIPAAITYQKDTNGSYVVKEYVQARDGSQFNPSIKDFCTMPKSKKNIKGLADQMIREYSNHEELHELLIDNLYKHLIKHGIKKATLTDYQGNVIFSLTHPKWNGES